MNWQETKSVLEKLGVKNLPENWQYRIYLRDANLRGADLGGADLRNADLGGADLRNADLRDADLGGAYLRGVDLRGAYLRGAYLRDANLRDADLRDADLRDAYLRDADLRDAYLRDAYLRDANLRGADLGGAYLRNADLPTYSKWAITWQADGIINIGCKSKTIAEWDEWFASNETFETERNTADFERIEAEYQHAKRMVEIYQKYEASEASEVNND